ncbi:MFS transporter permease [Microbacterium invictum]|uniref:MFS transporter permease n=1 Tax=Microbacterium invictum TaxID=515415 RepID=A0ABZ0VJK7_9MICO|nr:MFS transporter permease [Microbacterium invictum]WQB71947.1 MFS transporter permease [Microbacterium invictum]
MLLRRAVYRWLFPAAFVLPIWLLVGWGVFSGGGWAFLWVLLLGIPSVFLGQVVLTLLVRARGTVRAERAVSWLDVGGFAVLHALTVSLGFFGAWWWGAAFGLTIVAALALFWTQLWQLWREAKPSGLAGFRATASGYLGGGNPGPRTQPAGVVVIEERSKSR